MATITEKKLEYLQGTKDAIKAALIEKGQAVSDSDTFRSYADKILAIETGGGSGDNLTELYAETTLNGFSYSADWGAYIDEIFPAPYGLTVGRTYVVKWDNKTYTCVAQDMSAVMDGAVAIGNLTAFGGAGVNEPFAIAYINGGLALRADPEDTSTSHKVGIYQEVIYGYCGKNVQYKLYGTGLMTITGSGDMYDYPGGEGLPWYDYRDDIISVSIGNGVTSIGENAFNQCHNLTSITIGNGVKSIGSSTFTDCDSLTSLTIPDSVTSIGSFMCWNCDGLTSVTIGNGVTSIPQFSLRDCDSLTSLTIPDSVTSIERHAFSYNDGLTSINIPASVTSIGEGAFTHCPNLTSVTFEDTTTWKAGTAALSSSVLANPSTAATYLKDTYATYDWTKS